MYRANASNANAIDYTLSIGILKQVIQVKTLPKIYIGHHLLDERLEKANEAG